MTPSEPQTEAGRSLLSATICKCGIAESYHPRPDHEYERRYKVDVDQVLAIEREAQGIPLISGQMDVNARNALADATWLDREGVNIEDAVKRLHRLGYTVVLSGGIPLIDVELLRKALNDYDAFVAFREDDDRDVTIRDRHDWAERWVARLSESSPAEEDARPCPVCGTSGPHTVLGADDMPDHRWPAEEGAE